MTELRRMLDADASPVERWLLESARDDVPPRDGPRSLIRALGVGTTLASVAVASSLAQAAAEPAVAAGASGTALVAGLGPASAVALSGGTGVASATAASKLFVVLGAKWLGAGLVAGAITTGALRVATSPQSPEAIPPETPAAAMRRTQSGEHGQYRVYRRTGLEARFGSEDVQTDDQGRGAASARADVGDSGDPGVRSVPVAGGVSSRDPASIGAEVALVDEARNRLRADDVSGALDALSRYRQNYRSGAMWPEAARLGCEALRASGNVAAASSCAREFLAVAPTSPHAARMKSMLARSNTSNAASPSTPIAASAAAAPARSVSRTPAPKTRSAPAAAALHPIAPSSVATFPDG